MRITSSVDSLLYLSISIYHYKSTSEEGVLNKCICPEVQPLTLLYTIFQEKRYPFRIPSIDKWYPFHIPCLELCILLTAVNALSFKEDLVTKIECFLNLIKP